MAKRSYVVYHQSGSKFEVETTSIGAAAKRSAWPSEEITSVVALKPSPTRSCSIGMSGLYRYEAEGIVLESEGLGEFNAALEKMGFHGVEETVNLMNQEGGRFLIAAGTPSYCNPGCESYWSM